MKFSTTVPIVISIFIASLLCFAYCAEITDCGSEAGRFTKVSVSDCNEKQARCILKRGHNATILISFEINADTESEVTAKCFGKVLGKDVPFLLPNSNACVNSGVECPVKKGTEYTYSATFPVLKIYPKLDVIVKYELKNKENQNIVCVEIPVKIQ